MLGHVEQQPFSGNRRTHGLLLAAATAISLTIISLPLAGSTATAAEAGVGLGTAGAYSVLGGQAVTNTGPSTLAGNLGVSPGTAITGFPPGLASGATHAADAPAAQAQSDVVTAYDDAASRAPTASIAGDLVGRTLTAGVYKSTGPIGLSGTLTLDAQGNPNAVFIFQIASSLITASASTVAVVNAAQACHIYWQVASSATLGTASRFQGTVLALTSISVTTATIVHGRALARNGQVSLDDDVFTAPNCAPITPTSASSTATPTTTPTPASTPTPAAASSAGGGATSVVTQARDTAPSAGILATADRSARAGALPGTPFGGRPTSIALAQTGFAPQPALVLVLLLVGLGAILLLGARPRGRRGHTPGAIEPRSTRGQRF